MVLTLNHVKFPKKTVTDTKCNQTFEKNPSILKIKELSSGCRFSFENFSLEDVKKVTRELDISKASQLLDIPTKII